MKKLQMLLQRVRLHQLRTPPLAKAVVMTAIVLSTVTLIVLQLGRWESEAKLSDLQEKSRNLARENAALSERIENIDSLDSIRQIAGKELDLVNRGTIIISESE